MSRTPALRWQKASRSHRGTSPAKQTHSWTNSPRFALFWTYVMTSLNPADVHTYTRRSFLDLCYDEPQPSRRAHVYKATANATQACKLAIRVHVFWENVEPGSIIFRLLATCVMLCLHLAYMQTCYCTHASGLKVLNGLKPDCHQRFSFCVPDMHMMLCPDAVMS